MILQAGDRVRPWHNAPYFSATQWEEWCGGVPGGLIVEEVVGPLADEDGVYYVRASLPAPHNQRSNDNHYRVRDTGEAWRMRNAGTALVLLARSPSRKTVSQLNLFSK